MAQFRFPKAARMCLKTDIDLIMSQAETVRSKNLILKYRIVPRSDSPFKILIIASKRRYKLAVTRNRLKRQLREIFRLNQALLLESLTDDHTIHLAIIYSGSKDSRYSLMEAEFKSLMNKLSLKKLNKN